MDERSFSGDSVAAVTTSSHLDYNEEYNGNPIFSPSNGTVRFYFQPNWSADGSGTPPSGGCLFGYVASTNSWGIGVGADGASLSLSGESNDFSAGEGGYFNCPVNFQDGKWYQIAVAYSPTNVACYINGLPVSGAYNPMTYGPNFLFGYDSGMVFYPSISGAGTVSIGNLAGQAVPCLGQIDEMETFNYPLSAKAIGYGFPSFGDAANSGSDTDYDGRSDMLEVYVDNTSSNNPNNVVQCRLGSWRFDTSDMIGEQGQVPISSAGASLTNSWSGTALNIGAGTSHVTYNDVLPNGWATINCRQGTLRFWFLPRWNTTTGGTFLALGNTNTGSGNSQWSLNVNSSKEVTLATATNGGSTVPLTSAAIPFSSSQWIQIVLTYGAAGTTLYTNGVLAATGGGVSLWPNSADRARGVVIGNNAFYDNAIDGEIDELETFNYQLSASEILTNFLQVQSVDTDLNGVPDLLEELHLSTNRPFLGQPTVVTGTIEAEQFDQGGNGVAYYTTASNPSNTYRPTAMFITNCDDTLGTTNASTFGYCLDQTHQGEWVDYTIQAVVPGTNTVEVRVKGIGTNGTFALSFSNANNHVYSTNGPLTIPTNTWCIVATNMFITNGISTMRLTFLGAGKTNSISTGQVGKFNYISIYPYWKHAGPNPANNFTIPTTWLNAGAAWTNATNNAIVIQTNLNLMATSNRGGTVTIPPGTWWVAQQSPNESNPAWQNVAVAILASNMALAGSGVSNTTLLAYDRATTIISLGISQPPNQGFASQSPCTNFTLRDIRLEGQPHLVSFTNASPGVYYTNLYEAGGFSPTAQYTGSLVYFQGDYATDPVAFAYDLCVSNCCFLHADCSILLFGLSSNVLVTGCSFTQWDATNNFIGQTNQSPTNTSNTAPYPANHIGVFGTGSGNYNILFIGNSYVGDTLATNNSNGPSMVALDGFAYLQGEGNTFFGRNSISNYRFEGLQFAAGPNAATANYFFTPINDLSTVVLSAYGSAFLGASGTGADYSTCFVCNWMYGGRNGSGVEQSGVLPFTLNSSGNWAAFYPPTTQWNENPGGFATGWNLGHENIIGNTLASGGHGLYYSGTSQSALLLNNDFRGATYKGVGWPWSSPIDTINQISIFGNLLGEGTCSHVQVQCSNTSGWFLNKNTYYRGANIVAPFIDPLSSSIHLNP